MSWTVRGRGSTIIIRVNEMNWVTNNISDVMLEPGDFIRVPKNTPSSFWTYIQRNGRAMSIVGTMVTIVLLVAQSKK